MTGGDWILIALMGFLTMWLGIPAVIRALRGEPATALLHVSMDGDDDEDDPKPLTREQATDIARAHALRYGIDEKNASYLPHTVEEAERFQPHLWVVDAIIHGSEVGISRAR